MESGRASPEGTVPHNLGAEEANRTGPKEGPGFSSQDPLYMTHVGQLVLTSQTEPPASTNHMSLWETCQTQTTPAT